MSDVKWIWFDYLENGHDTLLWKLDGLSPAEQRRPRTPTGTNILGVVKHVAWVQAGYLGDCFARPFPEPSPMANADADPQADLYAQADESTADITALLQRVREHSRETVTSLELDAPGQVPWWPAERRDVTLGQILAHLVAEVHRHAGQIDIIREQIDGETGYRPTNVNMPEMDWDAYTAKLEQLATEAKD